MTSTNPMPAQSVQALIAAGGALAEPATFSLDDAPAALTAVVPDGYRLETAYLASNLDPHRPAPRRTRSRVKLDDIASWVLYLSRRRHLDTSRVGARRHESHRNRHHRRRHHRHRDRRVHVLVPFPVRLRPGRPTASREVSPS